MSAPHAEAAAEGMPAHPTAAAPEPFNREHKHPTDAALVRRLETPSLLVLFDAMSAMAAATTNVLNQPRCTPEVSDWLEVFGSRFSDVRAYIVEEFKRRPMSGDHLEDEQVMGCVLSWELKDCSCSAAEAMAILAHLTHQHELAAGKTARRVT